MLEREGVMVKQTKPEWLKNLLMPAVIILLIEITFLNSGVLFSAFSSAIFIYFGKKKFEHTIGKIFLMIGGIIAVVTIINMITFKLILLGLLAFYAYQYYESKKKPVVHTANFNKEEQVFTAEQLHSKPLLFKNAFLGGQKTSNNVYEWEDINVQGGIGDFIIDLSNTVLPKGESVICIRNLIGGIHIHVPYEIEVEVLHSVVFGSSKILENPLQRSINQNLHFHTSNYEQSDQKIKIVTNILVGDLEVKRI